MEGEGRRKKDGGGGRELIWKGRGEGRGMGSEVKYFSNCN